MKAFHAEIVYTPNDIELATEYSKRLGNTTVRVANDSVNYGDKRTRGAATASKPARSCCRKKSTSCRMTRN